MNSCPHSSAITSGTRATDSGGYREGIRGIPGMVPFPAACGCRSRRGELGYRLRKSAWGKGYATEGSRALIRKGFTEYGVQRVVAAAMAVNQASRRVMGKAVPGQYWPRPAPNSP